MGTPILRTNLLLKHHSLADPHLVDGRIHLAIEPIGPYGKPSDNDINEDFGEEVL